MHGSWDVVRIDGLERIVSQQVTPRVTRQMIPAYIGVLVVALDLFAISVQLERGFTASLWDLFTNQDRVFYVLSLLVVVTAVIFHLLEFGGVGKLRGRPILTLGTAGLLTGISNLNLLFQLDGAATIFLVFLALATIAAFAMAITDIVFRAIQKPELSKS